MSAICPFLTPAPLKPSRAEEPPCPPGNALECCLGPPPLLLGPQACVKPTLPPRFVRSLSAADALKSLKGKIHKRSYAHCRCYAKPKEVLHLVNVVVKDVCLLGCNTAQRIPQSRWSCTLDRRLTWLTHNFSLFSLICPRHPEHPRNQYYWQSRFCSDFPLLESLEVKIMSQSQVSNALIKSMKHVLTFFSTFLTLKTIAH